MTTSKHIVNADDQTFEDVVIKSNLPTLVDFWASWCAPCHMLAPVIDQLARDHFGRVKFVKVDIDKAQKIASSLGIRSIPTVIIFDQGKAVAQKTGMQAKEVLKKFIQASVRGT